MIERLKNLYKKLTGWDARMEWEDKHPLPGSRDALPPWEDAEFEGHWIPPHTVNDPPSPKKNRGRIQ